MRLVLVTLSRMGFRDDQVAEPASRRLPDALEVLLYFWIRQSREGVEALFSQLLVEVFAVLCGVSAGFIAYDYALFWANSQRKKPITLSILHLCTRSNNPETSSVFKATGTSPTGDLTHDGPPDCRSTDAIGAENVRRVRCVASVHTPGGDVPLHAVAVGPLLNERALGHASLPYARESARR